MNGTTLDDKLYTANLRIQQSLRRPLLLAMLQPHTIPDYDPLPPFNRARRPRPPFEAIRVVEARGIQLKHAA